MLSVCSGPKRRYFGSLSPLLPALLLALASGPLAAHELPPGVVERAVQATLYLDRLEVAYRFGMSEPTIRAELEKARGEAAEELTELEQRYLAIAGPQVAATLEVTWNGERVPLDVVAHEMVYEHHLQFESRLTYRLPLATAVGQLVIDDPAFPELPGHFRVACKARDDVPITRSNVAPILVRAERLTTRRLDDSFPIRPRIEITIGDPEAARPVEPAVHVPTNIVPAEDTTPSRQPVDRPRPAALGWWWWLAAGLALSLACLPLALRKPSG